MRNQIAPLQAKQDELSRKQDESSQKQAEVNLELKSSIQDLKTSTAAATQDLKNSNQVTAIVATAGAAATVFATFVMSQQSGVQSQEKNKTDVEVAKIAADSQEAKAKLDLEAARIAANSQIEIAKINASAKLDQGTDS